jgi:hypothetical protein
MINALITLLIVALVLLVIYYLVGLFIKGTPLTIIAIILGLVLLVYALRVFNIGLP